MNIHEKHTPDEIEDSFKKHLLEVLIHNDGLGSYEISLFEWYTRETTTLINKMMADESAYIQEQVDAGVEDINDSGIVAVEYYIKRVRYADVIYMASLLETYLDNACATLKDVIGEQNILFDIDELTGDKWFKRRKFLERYGKFVIPENIWSEIFLLTTIRNSLVHDNGNISSLSKKQKSKIKKQAGIDVDSYEIVIEETYIHHAFSAMRLLIKFVEEELGKIIERAIRF